MEKPMRSGLASVLFVACLGLGGCATRPLGMAEAQALIAADPSFTNAEAELALAAGTLAECPLFRRFDQKVYKVGSACEQVKALAATESGEVVVTLPGAHRREVLEVKGVSDVDRKEKTCTATFRWRWVREDLGADLAPCFYLEPRQSLATFGLKDGKWMVKSILVEKLGVQRARCR